ncbi:MAG: tetratricopeptide repeat protein [Chitinispirillaceae bacterium]|nr:tetratricopeptide repeat protein [Chitinispirillaceae bacterium]
MAFMCSPARFPVVRPLEKTDRVQAERAKAEMLFVMARDRERRGLALEALRCYELAYEFDPSSRELMEQVVRCCVNAGKYGRALSIVNDRGKRGLLTAQDRRTAAGIYWKMGEHLKAVESTEAIAGKEDADYYSLAALYEATGNAEKALRNYCECYRLNDNIPGLAQKIMRMQCAQKQFAAAESLAVALQKKNGESAELHDFQGVVAMERGDTAAALDRFGRALAVDSMHEGALRNAALIYMKQTDYGKAAKHYETLYRRPGPYKVEYGRTLAMLYYYGRRYADAEGVMLELAENFVGDAEFHMYLGLVFAAGRKTAQARIEMEKAVVLREDYAEAWRELINLLLREKKYGQALETAGRWLKRAPEDGAALRLAGYAMSLQKKYSDALSYFKKAVAIDSMDAGGWFELGSCYERNGDIARAAGAFRRVLRLRPDDPSASNYLGYMWADKGLHLDSAKTLLESALSKDPFNGAFLDSYAWIFYKKGDADESYRFIIEAVRRIRDDPVVFEHVGDILLKRNDFAGAAKAYRWSLDHNHERPDVIRKKIIDCEALLRNSRRGG